VSCFVNPGLRAADVAQPSEVARAFHEALPGYRPTPLRPLPAVAAALGIGEVLLKDESDRLGLPAFKVLGASWAIERALRTHPDVRTLVAASAGNHGRAVAHVAASRGLACRVYLPARARPARRAAIEREGAEVVVVDGGYEEAVAAAAAAGREPGCLELADVGTSGPAHDVIDGYATLFAEVAEQAGPAVVRATGADAGTGGGFRARGVDLVLVPVGVGSLGAAAARFGAAAGIPVIAVEAVDAACLTASLRAGEPTVIPTPGTTMAGLDCAEVSPGAWPDLRAGIAGTVTVSDDEAAAAMAELQDGFGLAIGECGAAPLAALRALAGGTGAGCTALRDFVGLGASSRVLLVATEGRTGGP